MAQGDPNNPASPQGNPRPESLSWGASSPSSQAGANSSSRRGETDGSTWIADPAKPSWELNPSSPTSTVARRRNQWRQYRHMTPDFGLPSAPPEPEPVVRPAPASLPRFKAKPAIGQGGPGDYAPSTPARTAASSPLGFPPMPPSPQALMGSTSPASPDRRREPSPIQLHPHSTPPDTTTASVPPATTGPVRSKVTPLRPLPYRSQPQPGGAKTAALAESAPGRQIVEGSPRPRSRPGPARRRLAKPPLPLLYLIRMVILGVGVAAIAGTLLSVLSPSQLTSSSEQGSTLGNEPLVTKTTGALIQGGAATAVTDIQLTSELTRLKAQLEQLVTLTPRLTPTLFLLDLDGGRYVDIGGSDSVAAASTIKVPILVAFLQQVDAGTIALNQGLTLQESQVAGGSGDMRNDSVGTQYTALEVATRMIVTSDNTATNMMIAALGGPEALNQTFAAWGMESTVIRNPLPDIEGTNTSSAKDLALLVALVDQGGLLAPRSRDRMFSIMQRTVNRALIPSGLGQADIVANKTGDIGMMLGDVALIDASNGERYVLTVLVQRPDNDGRANELIRRMTETAHGELNQPIAPVGGVEPASTDTGPETLPETGDTPGSTGDPPASITPEASPQPAADEIPPG